MFKYVEETIYLSDEIKEQKSEIILKTWMCILFLFLSIIWMTTWMKNKI